MTILRFVFQPRCVVCNHKAASNTHWCFSCLRELVRATKKSSPRALLEYRGEATKQLLQDLRSEHHSFALRFLGKAMARRDIPPTFDYIVAAPQRNNTTGLSSFGKKLADLIGAEFVNNAFGKKFRHSQHARSAVERLDGELFVFLKQKREKFQGKRILIIDDVSTTGTTLIQCRAVLRRAEAKEIDHLVLARRPEVERESQEAS